LSGRASQGHRKIAPQPAKKLQLFDAHDSYFQLHRQALAGRVVGNSGDTKPELK
jgi:hypothetical protein